MDFIDETAITNKIVNPAIDRVKNELLPQVDQILKARLDQVDEIIDARLTPVIAAVDRTSDSLGKDIEEVKTIVLGLQDFIAKYKLANLL